MDAEAGSLSSVSDSAASAVKSAGRDFGKILESLLGNTETFMNIMEGVSEVSITFACTNIKNCLNVDLMLPVLDPSVCQVSMVHSDCGQ